MTSTTSGAPASGERTMCLLFRVGEERFAIRASDVQKVTPVGSVSRLPLLPRTLVGITQHRGRVVTIVDAATLLHGHGHGPSTVPPTRALSSASEQRLLILERPVRHLALLVEAVFGIESLRLPADLAHLPRGGVAALRVAQQRGRALPLVDVAAVVEAVAISAGGS